MTKDLAYECPHCNKVITISPGVINETVNCPQCDKQFQAQAPVGHPVKSHRSPSSSGDVVETEASTEQTLLTRHPVVFRNHLLLTILLILDVLAGLAALVLGFTGKAMLGMTGSPLISTGAVLLVVAGLYAAYRWIQSLATTLTVTTQRTIVVNGLFAQQTSEVQHDDVRNIKSERNVLERLLNYGDMALSSSGQDDMEIVVHDIPDPQGTIELIRKHQ